MEGHLERDPLALRPLGRTGLQVTGLCVGGSPLGSMSALYGLAAVGAYAAVPGA